VITVVRSEQRLRVTEMCLIGARISIKYSIEK
jgi:hypothetical protein